MTDALNHLQVDLLRRREGDVSSDIHAGIRMVHEWRRGGVAKQRLILSLAGICDRRAGQR